MAKVWRLNLMSRAYPSFDSARVLFAHVSYDEETSTYYIADTAYDVRTLDAEFYLREFRRFNPHGTAEVCEFMSRFGLITNPYSRRPLIGDGYIWPDTISENINSRLAIDQANSTASALNDRHGGIVSRVREHMPWAYPFASASEVDATLAHVQRMTASLVRAHTEGVALDGPALQVERANLMNWVGRIVGAVGQYFPLAEVAPVGVPDVDDRPLPLAIAVYVQLLAGLRSEVGYKLCPQCGQWFMYKRNRDGVSSRDPRSTYCSDYCQRRANHIKDNERQRERRHAAKGKGNDDA